MERLQNSGFHTSQDEDTFKHQKVVADPQLTVAGFSLCVDRKRISHSKFNEFNNSLK